MVRRFNNIKNGKMNRSTLQDRFTFCTDALKQPIGRKWQSKEKDIQPIDVL
jgi:hypothetical protein